MDQAYIENLGMVNEIDEALWDKLRTKAAGVNQARKNLGLTFGPRGTTPKEIAQFNYIFQKFLFKTMGLLQNMERVLDAYDKAGKLSKMQMQELSSLTNAYMTLKKFYKKKLDEALGDIYHTFNPQTLPLVGAISSGDPQKIIDAYKRELTNYYQAFLNDLKSLNLDPTQFISQTIANRHPELLTALQGLENSIGYSLLNKIPLPAYAPSTGTKAKPNLPVPSAQPPAGDSPEAVQLYKIYQDAYNKADTIAKALAAGTQTQPAFNAAVEVAKQAYDNYTASKFGPPITLSPEEEARLVKAHQDAYARLQQLAQTKGNISPEFAAALLAYNQTFQDILAKKHGVKAPPAATPPPIPNTAAAAPSTPTAAPAATPPPIPAATSSSPVAPATPTAATTSPVAPAPTSAAGTTTPTTPGTATTTAPPTAGGGFDLSKFNDPDSIVADLAYQSLEKIAKLLKEQEKEEPPPMTGVPPEPPKGPVKEAENEEEPANKAKEPPAKTLAGNIAGSLRRSAHWATYVLDETNPVRHKLPNQKTLLWHLRWRNVVEETKHSFEYFPVIAQQDQRTGEYSRVPHKTGAEKPVWVPLIKFSATDVTDEKTGHPLANFDVLELLKKSSPEVYGHVEVSIKQHGQNPRMHQINQDLVEGFRYMISLTVPKNWRGARKIGADLTTLLRDPDVEEPNPEYSGDPMVPVPGDPSNPPGPHQPAGTDTSGRTRDVTSPPPAKGAGSGKIKPKDSEGGQPPPSGAGSTVPKPTPSTGGSGGAANLPSKGAQPPKGFKQKVNKVLGKPEEPEGITGPSGKVYSPEEQRKNREEYLKKLEKDKLKESLNENMPVKLREYFE